MNLTALRVAGAAITAAPAPAAPPLEDWAERLRCTFDAGYAESLEIRLGLRNQRGRGSSRPRGGYAASHLCFDCHRFVSGKWARCGSCGYEHGGQNHDAVAIA